MYIYIYIQTYMQIISIRRFPEMGVPPNHPFFDGFSLNQPVGGFPHDSGYESGHDAVGSPHFRVLRGFAVGQRPSLHQRDSTPCGARRAGHGLPIRGDRNWDAEWV